MRFISIFSISILSLSVWGLFLILFNYNSEPDFQVESSLTEEVTENEKESQDEDTSVSDQEEQEMHDEVEEDEALIIEADQLENVTEEVEVIEEENMPKTLAEMASSPYNDILYDFEKEYPVSVDDLLEILALN